MRPSVAAAAGVPENALLEATDTLEVKSKRGVVFTGLTWPSQQAASRFHMVLMRLLSWARERGLTVYRPPERVERLYHADRSEKIWSEPQIAAFMAVASEPLQRVLVTALETGQRQGDLLLLPWSAYDGTWIRLRQGKTGRHVNIL